jgi:predicted nucleotidyltransferase
VLVWPDREQVDRQARAWAAATAHSRPDLRRIGYFGSYARNDWGVGSDLDLVAIVGCSGEPFERRSLSWPLEALPVPAEILVYTESEWDAVLARGGRFADTLVREVVWIW